MANMGNTSQQLAARLREVFLDGRWIANTNYREQLEGLTREQALQKIGPLNSIALLIYHIDYYLVGLLKVFEGGPLDIRDQYSFDMPPIHSEAEWQQRMGDFLRHAEAFARCVERFPEHQWAAPFVDPKYGDYLRNVEGVIEHAYYHLGQVVLLKKMVVQ